MLQIVYVLTNPAMPGLVKIGWTTAQDANSRIAQLYTTGVPVPFKLEYACKVQNGAEVEDALHAAFAPNRINLRREFFKIEPEQAVAIFRLLHTEDATSEVSLQPAAIDEESIAAGEQLRQRRPKMNFEEMGIPVGAELRCIHDGAVVTVTSAKKVRFGDEEMSLTAATRLVKQIEHSIQPGPHWTYNGRLLRDIYEDTYGDAE